MFRVRSLGSGSSGNAMIVDDGATLVLIDCGVSFAAIQRGLATIRRQVEEIAAVLISHEHVDHVRALARVQRAGIPVISTAGTARAADISSGPRELLRIGQSVTVRTLSITALPVSHDAAEPCGFQIQSPNGCVTIVTDTGVASDNLWRPLSESDLIILEANHDIQMLKRGPYPAHLKQRVLSHQGHLSNDSCAEALATALKSAKAPVTIWLAHLSAVNNRPDLAVATVAASCCRTQQHLVEALPRGRMGRLWQPGEQPPGRPTQLLLPGLAVS
jgi:phosphoribosyl 1,2-cyclic phosphodiesterase